MKDLFTVIIKNIKDILRALYLDTSKKKDNFWKSTDNKN